MDTDADCSKNTEEQVCPNTGTPLCESAQVTPPATPPAATASDCAPTVDILSSFDEPPKGDSDAEAAVRDALSEYKDALDRELVADESKTLSTDVARRWHQAHQRGPNIPARRRKRGS